jgi:hypothetical protein
MKFRLHKSITLCHNLLYVPCIFHTQNDVTHDSELSLRDHNLTQTVFMLTTQTSAKHENYIFCASESFESLLKSTDPLS